MSARMSAEVVRHRLATGTSLRPARLGPAETLRIGACGLRAHPLRAVLAAAGVALGIAALVAVVGVAASSRAALDRELARLGTNLLTVEPGRTVLGDGARLPTESVRMAGRIAPMRSVSATGRVEASVYRNDHMPVGNTGGLAVLAVQTGLLGTVGGEVEVGRWLNGATAAYPATVLGARAARQLATHTPGTRVWLGEHWFSLVGILRPVPLAPELDNAALVGWASAQSYLGFDGHPTTLYCRPAPSQVEAIRSVLPATVNPRSPYEVRVSRPSDALAAERATIRTMDGLLLGLG
ncbi:MAG TPA: ABC transporter permease, partial [Micromonosporaceae bacterium]|nr:ABC transporter permease [Micromonosporaceae bacterium]